MSQIIKKRAVILKAGINAFIFEKYLNLLSQEKAAGKEIVMKSKMKYKLISLN